MNKLKMWSPEKTWGESEAVWDKMAEEAAASRPLKTLKTLPNMPGITAETAKNLKWKSLKWMVAKDDQWTIFKHILKHPLRYAASFLRSVFKPKSFVRDDDFFFYGIESVDEFCSLLKDPKSLFVVGFSYCHKPLECPSGRFNDQCIHDASNPICQQCFIGKVTHTLPDVDTIPVVIPTIHYIGAKIFEVVHSNPGRQVIFLITACEMTLEMFGDWGNMAKIKGIGVRLDGRICNTMKAFELSERGIKPGLTVVLPHTQKRILALMEKWREKDIHCRPHKR